MPMMWRYTLSKGKSLMPAQPKVNNVMHVADWTTSVKFAYTQIQTGERAEANQQTTALQEGHKQTL